MAKVVQPKKEEGVFEISGPTGVQHQGHVGFSEKGIEVFFFLLIFSMDEKLNIY